MVTCSARTTINGKGRARSSEGRSVRHQPTNPSIQPIGDHSPLPDRVSFVRPWQKECLPICAVAVGTYWDRACSAPLDSVLVVLGPCLDTAVKRSLMKPDVMPQMGRGHCSRWPSLK
ncbi:hypothetical protein G6O67_005561 [Ophiocordyceps sinensis]|uniref:Uncharacterized protein n=1 Tax=Ophiocordyceps sinensis TaxID=72228 RepID=A0A8H4PRU6_9HYPO|nr:hypothetical protein G6O67_005561 [Ophiocordyceps sinensis]